MARTTKFTKKTGVLSEAEVNETVNGEEIEAVDTVKDVVETTDEITTEVENTVDVDTSESQDTFSPSIPSGDDVNFAVESKTQEVKIRLNKDHKCCIGGERYFFKKDKVYTVNPNIKRILNKSGLLKPLN